jgi:hypothetical protein
MGSIAGEAGEFDIISRLLDGIASELGKSRFAGNATLFLLSR